MSPVTGGVGDYAEVKDIDANVAQYTSASGEEVAQMGFCLGGVAGRFGVGASNATVPASASVVYTNATVAASGIVLTLPAASAVTPGRLLLIKDENGTATSGNTLSVQTPSGGGTIDGTAAATKLAVVSAAYGMWKAYSDGTNWHVW